MKKILAGLFLISGLAFAGTYTDNIGLYAPEDHETGWGGKVSANFEIIDSSVATLAGDNSFTGANNFNLPSSLGVPGTVSSVTVQAVGNLGGGISLMPAWTSGVAGVIESSQQINFDTPGNVVRFLQTPNASYGVTAATVAISNSSNSYYGMLITSTGTRNGLRVVGRGLPDNSVQSLDGGVVNIQVENHYAPGLVIVSSFTDAQKGAGILEIWQESINHNDPHLWIHAKDHQSAGNIRIDSDAPNFEIVNTSTDNTKGFGKWEPFAAPYQSARLQVASSRCYDDSSFNNLAYWEPMSKGGGLFLLPFDATGCESASGFSASSQTASINFFTLNSRTVGLSGPSNTSASWTFKLPSTFSNGGQVLYQATSSSPRNWEFTVGGSTGTALHFNSTTGAPYWDTATSLTATSATLLAASPGAAGRMYFCSDCANTAVCVSTGTGVGAFSRASSRTARCD